MTSPTATITPSPARRLVSITIILSLGVILIYLALSAPPASAMWQVFLLTLGVGALVLANKLRQATLTSIILTDDGLVNSLGVELCKIDDITGIDRGTFAFKPSNGFLIRTRFPQSRVWAPGLWWRMGRRIGVGGVTPAGQGKFMAELIAMRIAERESSE